MDFVVVVVIGGRRREDENDEEGEGERIRVRRLGVDFCMRRCWWGLGVCENGG